VVVLPLKVLRGRPDVEFLAFSLPDAIAASLAERPTIAVRSPLAVQRHGGADADVSALADVMGARFALTGTLACLDDCIAVRMQLLAIPSGTVMWSSSRVATVQELFELQDAIARHVADTLPISTSAERSEGQGRHERDVPADPGAYAFYLRANQLAYEVNHWHEARALYRVCVEADPQYAPAWARLARCERLIGKYSVSVTETQSCFERAEQSFQRALALNPELPIAHGFYAQLLIDVGRAQDAMERLLARAANRPLDAEVYAGLVHALRFCGLLEASVAAHLQTKRLDPTAHTSVHHTWWMKGEYAKALAETFGDIGYMQGLALASQGREREAVAALRWRERETTETRIRPYLTSLLALLEHDRERCLSAVIEATALPVDAEALYYLARTLARLGEGDRAALELARVVDGGFWCADTFARDPWLDAIRGRRDVQRTLKRAAECVDEAQRRFARAGGFELIHITPPTTWTARD
jgi:TolB-like protein/tetratricopeptide (TPR) repeat protein